VVRENPKGVVRARQICGSMAKTRVSSHLVWQWSLGTVHQGVSRSHLPGVCGVCSVTRAICPGLIPNPIAVTLIGGPWDEIDDGTDLLAYYTPYGVDQDGTHVDHWEPVIGGTSADVLDQIGANKPLWNAADTEFGNLPTVYTSITDTAMRSNNETSAVSFSQPHDTLFIAKLNHVGGSPASEICDTADSGSTTRADVQITTSPSYKLNAGTEVRYYTAPPIYPGVFWVHWEGASTRLRGHLSDGTDLDSGLLDAGTKGVQGVSLFAGSAYTSVTSMDFLAFARCLSFSAADYARVIAWAQTNMSWS
jgi:hypothetical protein